MRTKVLFVSEAVTLAHAARPYLLASSLPPDRFDRHFASSGAYSFPFERSGISQHTIASHSPAEFEQILQQGKVLFSREQLTRYVKEELALFSEIRPAFVVGDFRLSLSISATLAHIPYIALTNAYWSPFALQQDYPVPSLPALRRWGLTRDDKSIAGRIGKKLFGVMLPRILDKQGAGLNQVRQDFGLSRFESYRHGFTSADYTLYSDVSEIVPVSGLPSNHRFIGPICWSPDVDLPTWWDQLPQEGPIAYLSLGSSGDPRVIPQIVHALEQLGITAIIATAGRLSCQHRPPSQFTAPFLPGEEVARRADFVICNGGSPSAYQALQANKPILGICANIDQLLCMDHIERFGAGKLLRSEHVNFENLKRLISQLLSDPRIKERAQLGGGFLRRDDATINFSRFIQSVVSARNTANRG